MDSDDPKNPTSGSGGSLGKPPTMTGDDAGDEEREIREDLNTFEKLSVSVQRRMFWATVAICTTTAVYAYFTYQQWSELQDANRRTDNIIQLGIANLRSANKAASEARNDTNRALAAFEKQATAMTESIGPAANSNATSAAGILRAAQDSLRASRHSLELTQRAYINTLLPTFDPQKGVIHVGIENTGRMPATRIYASHFDVVVIRSDQSLIHSVVTPFGGDRTTVPPGKGYYGVTIEIPDWNIGEVKETSERRELVSVAGIINYDTGFGTRDKYSFCWVYDPDPSIQWRACPVVTAADLNKTQ